MANNPIDLMTKVPNLADDNQSGMMTPDINMILRQAAVNPRFSKNLMTPTPAAMENQIQNENKLASGPYGDSDNVSMDSKALLDKYNYLRTQHPEVYRKSLAPYLKDDLATEDNKKNMTEPDDTNNDEDDDTEESDVAPKSAVNKAPAVAPPKQAEPEVSKLAAAQPAIPTVQQDNTNKSSTSPLMARLLDAQHQADLMRMGTSIAQGAELAGKSFQHKDQSALENQINQNLSSQANVPIDKLNQQLAIDKQDPDSQASQNFRQLLAQKYKIDPNKMQGMSIDQIIKVAPMFEKDAAAELKNQFQQLALQSKNDMFQQGLQNKLDLSQNRLDTQRDLANMRNDFNYDKLAAGADSNKAKATQKQASDDEREVAKASKEANGLSASSRSVVGNAEKIKFAAKRLNDILDDPNATPQDMSAVAADMNGLIAGTTTMTGTAHAEYSTLQNTLAKGLQYITSQPQAVDTPEVKQHIKDVANRMIKISDDVSNKHLNRVFAGRHELFQRHPDARQRIIDAAMDNGPSQANAVPNEGAAPAQTASVTPKSSDEDKEAIAWAKANPNDARSAQILKLHGM